MDAKDILQKLIRCPSVTPIEGGALHLLCDILRELGFTVELVTFSHDGTPDVTNLYARLGNGSPSLVFAGHTDVVPPGPLEKWRFPPFAGETSDGKLYGRGAVDMKGGIAAFVAALAAYLKKNGAPKGSIGFLITSDEEGPATNGTSKLLEWVKAKGERFDHCLLGEPSGLCQAGDRIKIGARGSYSARLSVTGKQGHVAYPERAQNPIEHLLIMLAALLEPPLDSGTEWFPPSNLEVTDLHVGNLAANVIPREAQASFNVRFNDIWTLASLELELRERINSAAGEISWQLSPIPGNSEPFRTEPGKFLDLVSNAVKSVTGTAPELSTSGGTSDARFIKNYCPVLELGPMGGTLHQVDEHIELADLERTVELYTEVLRSYFS